MAAEGLSQLIHQARHEGTLGGIEVAPNLCVTHLLFVDDILLFNKGNKGEIRTLKKLLDLFMKATGLLINNKKSTLTYEGISVAILIWDFDLLPFEQAPLEYCIKYLGFLLKPDGYRK